MVDIVKQWNSNFFRFFKPPDNSTKYPIFQNNFRFPWKYQVSFNEENPI